MIPTRRAFLGAALATLPALARADAPSKLGIVIHSYPIRGRVERERGFADPLRFLEFCRERGAGGVQVALGIRDAGYLKTLRETAERHGMYVEGSVRMPREQADVERFDQEIRTAKEAGASVVRTVMLSGRRYEVFKSAEEYRAFKEQSDRSLLLAEPVVTRRRMRLAVENHKDYRTGELIDVMKKRSSEYVGICVDTGNNMALLERAEETVEGLARWATACHLKDMAVEESPDGFLLSEVPLGDGILDLKRIVNVLRKARPEIRFSLEMITRDPLRIPCLTDNYWATLSEVPARDLARALSLVRKHARKDPLPRISTLSEADQLAVEEKNVRRSFSYARELPGL